MTKSKLDQNIENSTSFLWASVFLTLGLIWVGFRTWAGGSSSVPGPMQVQSGPVYIGVCADWDRESVVIDRSADSKPESTFLKISSSNVRTYTGGKYFVNFARKYPKSFENQVQVMYFTMQFHEFIKAFGDLGNNVLEDFLKTRPNSNVLFASVSGATSMPGVGGEARSRSENRSPGREVVSAQFVPRRIPSPSRRQINVSRKKPYRLVPLGISRSTIERAKKSAEGRIGKLITQISNMKAQLSAGKNLSPESVKALGLQLDSALIEVSTLLKKAVLENTETGQQAVRQEIGGLEEKIKKAQIDTNSLVGENQDEAINNTATQIANQLKVIANIKAKQVNKDLIEAGELYRVVPRELEHAETDEAKKKIIKEFITTDGLNFPGIYVMVTVHDNNLAVVYVGQSLDSMNRRFTTHVYEIKENLRKHIIKGAEDSSQEARNRALQDVLSFFKKPNRKKHKGTRYNVAEAASIGRANQAGEPRTFVFAAHVFGFETPKIIVDNFEALTEHEIATSGQVAGVDLLSCFNFSSLNRTVGPPTRFILSNAASTPFYQPSLDFVVHMLGQTKEQLEKFTQEHFQLAYYYKNVGSSQELSEIITKEEGLSPEAKEELKKSREIDNLTSHHWIPFRSLN